MASYAVMLALEGFSYNAAERRMGFAPKVFEDRFAGFWSVGSGWGTYAQRLGKKRRFCVEVRYGSLALDSLDVEPGRDAVKGCAADVDGREVAAEVQRLHGKTSIIFPAGVEIAAGETLTVVLS
jgi:hypothetical protein